MDCIRPTFTRSLRQLRSLRALTRSVAAAGVGSNIKCDIHSRGSFYIPPCIQLSPFHHQAADATSNKRDGNPSFSDDAQRQHQPPPSVIRSRTLPTAAIMEVMPTTIPSSMVFTSSENCCPSTAVPRYSFHPGWMMGSVSVINHQTWPSSPLPQRFRRQQQRLLRNSIPGNNNNNHVLLSSSHLFEASGSRLHSASLRAFSTTQFPLAASGSSGEGNHQQQPSGLSQSEAMDNFDEASFWSYFACDDAATAAYSSPSMSNISVVAEDYHMGTAEHESLNRSFLDAIPFHTNSDYSSVSPDSSSLLGSTTTTNTTVFSEDIAAGSEEIWYERYQAREAMKAAANSLENRIVPTGGHSKATKGRIIEVVDNE